MEQREIITADGEGVWGNQKYHVTLKTRRCTYHNSLGTSSKDILIYLLDFSAVSIAFSGLRTFSSEETRRSFLAEFFTGLVLNEIHESAGQWIDLISPVEAVVGRKLTAVNSVMDYLHLELPPYGFYVYNWPDLYVDGRILKVSDRAYQETLRGFIGKQILHFDKYLDLGITLDFFDGSRIAVPVKVDDGFICPEVAQFFGRDVNPIFFQANEEPFA